MSTNARTLGPKVHPLIRPYCFTPGKGRKVQFGFEKGLSKPASRAEWIVIYSQYKYYLRNVRKLSFQWCGNGKQYTGIRRFHNFYIPPLQFWNPDIIIHERKVVVGEATVIIEMMDGKVIELNVPGMHQDEIWAKLVSTTEGKEPVFSSGQEQQQEQEQKEIS